MTARLSARRPGLGKPHPLHAGPRRLAEIRAQALAALLAVAAAPFVGALLSILMLTARP